MLDRRSLFMCNGGSWGSQCFLLFFSISEGRFNVVVRCFPLRTEKRKQTFLFVAENKAITRASRRTMTIFSCFRFLGTLIIFCNFLLKILATLLELCKKFFIDSRQLKKHVHMANIHGPSSPLRPFVPPPPVLPTTHLHEYPEGWKFKLNRHWPTGLTWDVGLRSEKGKSYNRIIEL